MASTLSLSWIRQAWLGWQSTHNLSDGVELGSFEPKFTTTQQTATTEITLSVGHNGTKGFSIITAKPGSPSVQLSLSFFIH